MYRSSGPIPAATYRHSRGLFENWRDISALLEGFCLVGRCGGRVDSENESRRPLLLTINREFQIRDL